MVMQQDANRADSGYIIIYCWMIKRVECSYKHNNVKVAGKQEG